MDYKENGLIRDDDLYDIIVKELPEGVHVVALVSNERLLQSQTQNMFQAAQTNSCFWFLQMDCCHSGTILDLPYRFSPTARLKKWKSTKDSILGSSSVGSEAF